MNTDSFDENPNRAASPQRAWSGSPGEFWIIFIVIAAPILALATATYNELFLIESKREEGFVKSDQSQARNLNNEYSVIVLTDGGGVEVARYTKGSPPKAKERVLLTYYYKPITGNLARVVATKVRDTEAPAK